MVSENDRYKTGGTFVFKIQEGNSVGLAYVHDLAADEYRLANRRASFFPTDVFNTFVGVDSWL
jgi:hypothetical protein